MLRMAMVVALLAASGATAQQTRAQGIRAQETAAQETGAGQGDRPQRIRSVTLQKGERCPPSTGNEVVVCSTIGEPYRIPAPLRDSGPIPAANQAWANRASAAAENSRVAGGLPDTCSPIGTGGQSGCALMRNREWAAARRLEAQGTDGD